MVLHFLLQASFIPQADTKTMYITLAIFAGFIILLVIGSIAGKKSTGTVSSGSKPMSVRAGKKRFRRLARKLDLSPMQTKMLEDIAQKYRVPSPLSLLTSPNIFNMTMKKAVRDFDSGAYAPEVRENYKLMLFTVKQKLDRNSGTGTKISTSRQFPAGKKINLTLSTGERYESQILTNLKDSICVTIPQRSDGSMLRLSKWEPLTVSIWEKGDRGYTFSTKVMGYTTMKNSASMMLQHSSSISFSKQRSFPRKELGRPCYFYKINIATVGKGKQAVKKAVINDPRGRLGTVMEISAGGCSIRASNPLSRGELIKIDIDIEKKKTMSALGKIVNTRREGPGTMIMHIQFTRMSKNNLNLINSYVYGIGEKDTILDY